MDTDNDDTGKYFKARLNKLVKLLEKQKISNLIILKDENIYYISGFYGRDSESILLITDDTLYLLVNFIYLEQAKKSIKNKLINIACYKKDRFKKILGILEGYDFKKIGIEGKNISFTDFTRLKKVLSSQGKKLISTVGLIEKLRAVKDESEISKIKKSCNITDKAFRILLGQGVNKIVKLSEMELAFRLEELLVKNNSGGKSFNIIAAYGKNSSMPHHSPQKTRIKDGIILLDFGCRFEHYCSDMTRTIFTGNNKICNEFKKIYDIVLEAQLMAIEKCREGITAAELDRIARKFISSKGYGYNFGHGLGHGIGLEVHEEPVINSKNNTVLKENMAITIEPGIYIENFGGVRIEDMVLVRKSNCGVLYKSRKDFLVLS